MQDSAIRILCVEDEPDLREDLVDVLQECGYGVDAAHDGPTGFAMAQERRYDLILCDVLLPGITVTSSCRNCGRARAPAATRR